MNINRVWYGTFGPSNDPAKQEMVVIESDGGNLFLSVDQTRELIEDLRRVLDEIRRDKMKERCCANHHC